MHSQIFMQDMCHFYIIKAEENPFPYGNGKKRRSRDLNPGGGYPTLLP